MSRDLKQIINAINVSQAIQTLEQVAENGKNESARVAAAFKLLEVAGVSKGEGSGMDFVKDFYKKVTDDEQPEDPGDKDKLEESGESD